MATQTRRIVDGEKSAVHDEPHVADSRITVRSIHKWVEEAGLDPTAVADRHNLDVASVYRALAYYHEHPERLREVAQERKQTIEANRERAVTGPDDIE